MSPSGGVPFKTKADMALLPRGTCHSTYVRGTQCTRTLAPVAHEWFGLCTWLLTARPRRFAQHEIHVIQCHAQYRPNAVQAIFLSSRKPIQATASAIKIGRWRFSWAAIDGTDSALAVMACSWSHREWCRHMLPTGTAAHQSQSSAIRHDQCHVAMETEAAIASLDLGDVEFNS